MLELILFLAFVWLFAKALGLTLRVTWGVAKAVALGLTCLALPVLVVVFLIAGGLALLLPLALVAVAWCILKSCV